MISSNQVISLIFGFKVRYLRQKFEYSYQELSKKTGLSTSYLNDIEKGKKYPK
ncbi:MAG: helix-turn-helix transcriptional regulator, partial [Bacteroidota bacterium]